MRKINREDMLELTRRMTVKRNCFDRIAGAYLDEEGYVDATFNRHFLKLKLNEQAENLAIAKEIPFADTNKNLREYAFPEDAQKPGSIWPVSYTHLGQMDEFTYEIGVENAGERIDKFLSGELSELSRSYIQKLLKEGMVTLGGKALKANYRLREKDEIEIKICLLYTSRCV